MMAAYQPAGVGHPGLPHGHPGMAPTPGGHMGQPMQMHPGVSGAPHVSQPGAMMGMQPGAQGMGPGMGGQHPSGMMQAQMGGQSVGGGMSNAPAMHHMTPQQQIQQQMMMAQAQAQQAQNPQHAQQAQQMQMMRIRQQQMLAAQQAQQGAMGNNMHQQMQMTPQQMAQLQHAQQQQQAGNQTIQLPAHLMQQQMALHQQRMQHQAQQQQQTQMQQQMAMQHANSQQSNPSQPTPQNPQAQANNPQQIRPQSRMANPNEQSQPNQQQPLQPQAQQAQAQAQQAQQGHANPQQANTAQQMQQRQAMAMMQRQQFLQARQQQQAMQNQNTGQQTQSAQGGMFILRLMNFSDHLSQFNEENGKNIATWNSLVERHFANEGRIIHSFENSSTASKPRPYEVLRPNVARYFWTYFDSGASSLRLHTEYAREMPHPSGSHMVTCQNAIFTVSYPNGARLEMIGSLQVLFSASSDSIECLQFSTTLSEETISRHSIEKVVSDISPSMPNKSPKMSKNKLPKAQQKMQDEQNRLTMDNFPKTPKGTLGITSKVQHFLEIGETMNLMSDLMWYANEKKMRPEQALEQFVVQNEAQSNGQPQQGGNPQINLPPNGVPQGSRTPSMGNMQMPQNGQAGAFSSPSVANLNLPNGMNGSPHIGNNPGNLAPNMNMPNSHTPSPHQSNMAAPPMVPQHSQQGTNSSVASANTSPNINNNNKRRRSTVKLEGDDGGGGVDNSNKVKPSPRMAKKVRP